MSDTAVEMIREDGRAARGLRTRDAVVDALLALIEEGDLRPTARQISERACVSLRSVFQHFADLEALFAAASDRQVERMAELYGQAPTEGDFDERLSIFVEARTTMLEAVTPIRRAALLHEPFSAEIARRLKWTRDTAQRETAAVFANEIGASPDKQVVAALHAITDWYTWETLRRHQGLSVEESRLVMARMLRALLKKEE
jgi:TetR/AcrR family transcriptional regulator of autoinduction and epiphytic fitness